MPAATLARTWLSAPLMCLMVFLEGTGASVLGGARSLMPKDGESHTAARDLKRSRNHHNTPFRVASGSASTNDPTEMLHSALSVEDLAAVERALASGARVNQADSHGGTPLHRAAARASPRIAARLLEGGI